MESIALPETGPESRRPTAVDMAVAERAGVSTATGLAGASPFDETPAVPAIVLSAAIVAAFPGVGSGSDGPAGLPVVTEARPEPFELGRASCIAFGVGTPFKRTEEDPVSAKVCIAA